MRHNKFFTILLITVAAVFFFGIVNLFHIRFQHGDIYPAYSSLRSDPLGTKILFEGVNNIDGISAVRNYHPLYKIRHEPGTLYLFLGMHTMDFTAYAKKDAEKLESFVTDGGRIVIAFLPGGISATKCPPEKEKSCDITSKNGENTADNDEQIHENVNTGNDKDGPSSYVDLGEQWGVALEFHDAAAASDGNSHSKTVLITDRYNLPDTLSWHSRIYFRIDDSAWNEIYIVEGRPVLIERRLGNGKIILATDTYFASNEAMLKERRPNLLSWIIGSNRKILFDETHLGIVEQPNLALLVRKYRLHGLFASLLFLAVLFIWKNSTSFIPADKNQEQENIQVSSKDHLSGLVSLLRRNITSGDIVDVCFREWMKTPGERCLAPGDRKQIETIIEQERKTPVNRRNSLKSYESISQILDKRRYV